MFALCSLNVKLLVFVFIGVGSETGPARFHYVMPERRYAPPCGTCSKNWNAANWLGGKGSTGGYLGSIYVFDIIWTIYHITRVSWVVEISDEFEPEFDGLHKGRADGDPGVDPPAAAIWAAIGPAPR
jgi:hypothetical protein